MIEHQPVLLEQVIGLASELKSVRSILDLTAGYGGHSQALIEKFRPELAVLVDQDSYAIGKLKQKFGSNSSVEIVKQNFRDYDPGLGQFDLILADLGVSSPQLDIADRGFSYLDSGQRLDMRMDQTAGISAVELLEEATEQRLTEIFREYGELRFARSIARGIIAYRQKRPIITVKDLNQATQKYWLSRPKVQVLIYQAIRIAVNDELKALDQLLENLIEMLTPGGIGAIISFQSLEDRRVKRKFRELSEARLDILGREIDPAKVSLLTKRPIVPNQNQIVNNPRARSAKLRAIIKTKKIPTK